MQENVTAWNKLLHARAAEFRESTSEASVVLFSSHKMLSRLLDDPEEYDFCEDDTADEGGRIWKDELHLTLEVHDIFAEEIATFLLQL